MSLGLIITITFAYLGLLFLIASFFDRFSFRGKSLMRNPYVYSLSLTVYCTAWTYYGSVGNAATHGLAFLAIYIGPTLMMPLWWIVVRKMIRICHNLRITTLADFLAARFEQSWIVSSLVTIICLTGIVPYIAIQLKAITNSLYVLSSHPDTILDREHYFLNDVSFYVLIVLGLFVVFFTFRKVETTEKHDGLIGAIAVESLVKLGAFLTVGLFVTYGAFDGFQDLFSRTQRIEQYNRVTQSEWPVMIFLSMAAVVLLPRQFQMAIAENTDENHLRKAVWLFPLYLLVINIFVIPIAIGGEVFLGAGVDPDTYVLALPMLFDQHWLALLTYIGGFSAATGMIIVSTIALSTMFSQNVIIPLILQNREIAFGNRKALFANQFSVFFILLLAYLFYRFVALRFPIVSIGLISFVAISQFFPVMLATLYWKEINRLGAVMGLIAGFIVWGYTLVVPTIVQVGLLPAAWLEGGPFGISWLYPYGLFGSEIPSQIAHGTFWSLFFNVAAMSIGIVFGTQSAKEKNLADFYISPFTYGSEFGERLVWKGQLVYQDLIQVSQHLLGPSKVDHAVRFYKQQYEQPIEQSGEVKPEFVNYIERLLSGAVGATSARMLIASIAKEDKIILDDVVEIIRQKKETTLLNERLRYKSKELEQKTIQLEIANKRLKNLDGEKDEFISTVNHELRTPLTSIRALCEIIHDHDDMEDEERKEFLATIITESERMTRLINQVLDLEKLESGKTSLQKEKVELKALLDEVLFPYEKICHEKSLKLIREFVDEPLELEIDKDKITEVVINLTSNAITHTDTGYVKIYAERQNNHALVSIIDTGKGIKQEELDRIFDKFYQVKEGKDRKPGGSGLGLPIAKKLVNLHEGQIWVKSQPNVGSEFSFTIPLSN